MSNKESNWPTNKLTTVYKGSEEQRQAQALNHLWNLPEVDHSDLDAIKNRIQQYFNYCDEVSMRPTVSGLAAALKIRRETLWRWENAGGEKGELISQARGIMEAHIEQIMFQSKNPAASIFALKNHYGWKDAVEISTPKKNPLQDLPSQEEIYKRISGIRE